MDDAAPSGEPNPAGLTWLSAALLALAFGALTWWSWERWTQPLIDFGLELYVPWRLGEGEVLYRDIASRNGPLSHYFNALWFSLFGVSLKTLVGVNLALAAVITALVYRLIRRAFDPTAAFFCTAVFLGVFGFSQYVGVANYNYVTPYQHGQTHGVLLWLSTLWCLGRAPSSAAWTAAAGFAAGLAFLTKVEVFLPTGACLLLGAWLLRLRVRPLALGFLAPPVLAAALLATAMPIGDALVGVAGNWVHLAQGGIDQRFYATVMGTDDPLGNLLTSLVWFGAYLAIFVAGWLADRAPGVDRLPRFAGGVGAALAAAGLFFFTEHDAWRDLGRGLNLLALFVATLFVLQARREPTPPFVTRALWALGSLAFLTKLILHPRIYHYGFALAMPAALLLVALLVRTSSQRFSPGLFSRPLARGVVVAAVASLLAVSDNWYELKDTIVGAGADRMRALGIDPQTRLAVRTLEKLDTELAEGDSLLVLPEGTMINYLLRRENPSRYQLFLPPEFAAVGGDAVMVEDFERDPPTWVVLLDRDHREYGAGPFWISEANGAAIGRWFSDRARYERHSLIPVQAGGQKFTARLLKRK